MAGTNRSGYDAFEFESVFCYFKSLGDQKHAIKQSTLDGITL